MNSSSQTWNTILKQNSKKERTDSNVGTGDLLNRVNGIPTKRLGALCLGEQGGDGGIVVPEKGRVPGQYHNKRETRSPLHFPPLLKPNAKRYNSTPAHKREISSKPLSNIKTYQLAYDLIKNNAGSLTLGVDKQTVDGMSNERLTKIMEQVIKWQYKCKPARRIYIPKANGKLRPLGIPSSDDKIVQVAIKLLLEPRCEEIFHPKSFAYRPKRSAHQALLRVRGMVGIT